MKIVLRPEHHRKDPLDVTRQSKVPRRPQRHERVMQEAESLSLEERLDKVREKRRTREDKIRERLFKFDRQYEQRKQEQEHNKHLIRVRRFEASRASARRRAAAAAASIQRRRDWDQRQINAQREIRKKAVKKRDSPYVAPVNTKKETKKLLSEEEKAQLVKGNEKALKYKKKGKLEKAESTLRKLLKDYEEKKRREHSFVLIVLNNLAGILQDQKKFDEAEEIFREVLSTRERVLGANKPATVTSVNNLAFLLHQNKKDAEAKKLFLRALAQLSKQKGPRDLLTRNTRGNYGVSLMFGGANEAERSVGRRV